jgi:hypothetical protein
MYCFRFVNNTFYVMYLERILYRLCIVNKSDNYIESIYYIVFIYNISTFNTIPT